MNTYVRAIEDRVSKLEQTLSDRAPLLDKLTETIATLNKICDEITRQQGEKE